jgi:hypothetical protein
MKDKYTTKDISTTLGVSLRTAQRYLENLVKTNNGKTEIEKDVFYLLIQRHTNDNQATQERQFEDAELIDENDLITDYFTLAEYEEFKKRLTEYPLLKQMLSSSEEYINNLKNDLEYHRRIYQKHLDIHEKLIDSIKERNFIEAKEKKLDK